MGDDISDALDVCGRDHASPFVDIGDDADLNSRNSVVHGRGAAPQGPCRRLFPVLRRAARLRKADTIKRCLDTDLAFYAYEVFRSG